MDSERHDSPSQSSGRSSRSPSPAPAPAPVAQKKQQMLVPQLIGHLPRAEGDALRTFIELKSCTYQNAQLGRSRAVEEGMACECAYVQGEDEPYVACGSGSDCINRLTQIECLESECKCASHCQNQRFAKREYAELHIVQTEKKGFGLRAATDLNKDDFIYEYIGEVVGNTQFTKRIRDYADEGIRHFYFMMLQKDEFIDATKKGGIGRFANHSCNPNCYVAKWTVGKRIRMGIFASRKIQKDEELTFNYNVDRYGHEAQPCYCGEANCIGFIGGKTQTDVAVLDDLYLDALGISDEVEALGLKGNKRRKSKKLGEDYTPTMRPLLADDMPKIIQALRQTSSKKILERLLNRIKITEDAKALRQLLRLRILSTLGTLVEDYRDDVEITILILNSLETLTSALLNRNKIDDSKMFELVQQFAQSDNGSVRVVAEKLLQLWSSLKTAYRIPKRQAPSLDWLRYDSFDAPGRSTTPYAIFDAADRAPRIYDPFDEPGWSTTRPTTDEPPRKKTRLSPEPPPTPLLRPASYTPPEPGPIPQALRYRAALPPEVLKALEAQKKAALQPVASKAELLARQQQEIDEIIRQSVARAAALAQVQPASEEPTTSTVSERVPLTDAEIEERARERLRRRKERKERERARASQGSPDKAAKGQEKKTANSKELREKHLKKLIGAVVVKAMGKWQKQLNRDAFKDHAKKITEKVSESELRHAHGDKEKLKELSEKQVAKIHGFVKGYMEKIVYKLRKEAKAAKALSGTSSATPPVSDRTEKTDNGPDTPPDERDTDVRMRGADADAPWDPDGDAAAALYDDLAKELGGGVDDDMDTDSDSEPEDAQTIQTAGGLPAVHDHIETAPEMAVVPMAPVALTA